MKVFYFCFRFESKSNNSNSDINYIQVIMDSKVFEATQLGGVNLNNRIIRSATQEIMAQNGNVSNRLLDMYDELSKSGVGLIITGYMTFSQTDNHSPSTLCIENDERIQKLKTLTDKVHRNGTKIIAQLAHLGSQILQESNVSTFGPSEIKEPFNGLIPKALTIDQIKSIVTEFGQAALRAKKARFDGIQIHAAHGYLLSKFLSPVFNKRNDEYGGNIENNARIILEVVNEIKETCGKNFPVWIKLNSADYGQEQDSFDFNSAIATAKLLEKEGIDAIEMSGGTPTGQLSPSRSQQHEAYHSAKAQILSSEINTPVIAVGGFRDFKKVKSILNESNIKAISLSRALIRQPNLVKQWKDGDETTAKCIACNGCFNLNGIACIYNLDKEERKVQQAFLKKFFANN